MRQSTVELGLTVDGGGMIEGLATLSVGAETITHDRRGLRIWPVKMVVITIEGGGRGMSFHLDANGARLYSKKLSELADVIESADKVKGASL